MAKFAISGHMESEWNRILYKVQCFESARGVMVIVAGHGYGDTDSNPGRDWLHFT